LLDPLANPSEKSVVGHSVSHSRSLRGIGFVSNGVAQSASRRLPKLADKPPVQNPADNPSDNPLGNLL
jgi:hypothetical protein